MKINLLVISLAATVFCDVSSRGSTSPLSEPQAPKLTGTSSAKETSSLNRKIIRNKEQQRFALSGKKEQLGLPTNGGKSKFSASRRLGMQQNSGIIGKPFMQQALKETQQLPLMSGRSNGKLETQTRNRLGGRMAMQQRSLSSGGINRRSEMQRIAKINSLPKGWPSMQQVFINERRQNMQESQKNANMYRRSNAQGARMKSPSILRQSMNQRLSSNTGVDGRFGMQQQMRTNPFFKKRSQMQRGFEVNKKQGAQGRVLANGRANRNLEVQKETGMGGANSIMKRGSIRNGTSRRDGKAKLKQGLTMKDEPEKKSKMIPMRKLTEE